MRYAVTVGRSNGPQLPQLARQWAQQLGVPFLPRKKEETLDELLQTDAYQCLIVATQEGPQIFSSEGKLFYHPGMAVLRLQRLQQGEPDNFALACGLHSGMRFLDCTLGLASDALIASFLCGTSGRVVGLEASPPLWFIVSQGLSSYEAQNPVLTQAMRRLTALHKEAGAYLKTLTPNSYDVVYFDPMFKTPVSASSNMQPLRPVSYNKPLTQEIIETALQVAPLVVIKERSLRILQALGAQNFQGGKYSKIKYGIIRR